VILGLINVTPSPTIVQIGPVPIGWYGVLYVVALGVMFALSTRELERRGIEQRHFWNAVMLVVALSLIGGRLYHVIHEWHFYQHDLLRIVLPPYAGLGLFGGIVGALVGIAIYGWRHRLPVRRGLDAVIPGTLFAQGIARWGNFFNQELYGPPTDAPWGIAIDCAHRIAQYPCSTFPRETTGFHPLFFYESALNIIGGLIALWLSRRHLQHMRAGDLAAFWGIWYGATRTVLETFREGWNWTLQGGLATAQLIGIAVILIGVGWLIYNHRPGARGDEPPPAAPRRDHVPPDDGRGPVAFADRPSAEAPPAG
jgi:phosphatidylglycerol---prolipoprotein diacylglyceryl transferase